MDNERQNVILRIMKSEKNVTVHDLASRLYVCEATIRRDLTAMQRMGVVRRSHGGALIAEAADEISMFVRMNVNAKEKEAVAANALPHIPDVKSLFIDSSSTALALAQRLDLAGKTVVTNNLQTALSLSRMEDINLIILGGNITLSSVSITGSWTARQLQSFSFDLMLASCASIRKRTAFEKTLDQREIKQVAYENSAVRVLLADSTKINARAGIYIFGNLSEFDLIVCDKIPPEHAEDFEGLPVIAG